MTSGPIRRGQLITPFGVGSMVVNRDGVSLICCGLDHWYEPESVVDDVKIKINEFIIHEWRLERLLNKKHFRLPPDFRIPKAEYIVPNANLTIPFLRFPTWHACPGNDCNRLFRYPMTMRGKRGRIECPVCAEKKLHRVLYQVPIIAICDHGHIQDFPWSEWVHQSINPACDKQLYLKSTGAGTLAGLRVTCDCGANRPLFPIMGADLDKDTTDLTENLDNSGNRFLCSGLRPWLGVDSVENKNYCGRPLRGSLRSASNVYFPVIKTSVYLPRTSNKVPSKLISLLDQPPISGLINLLKDITTDEKIISAKIVDKYSAIVKTFNHSQIESAVQVILGTDPNTTDTSIKSSEVEDKETAFRRLEFDVLRNQHTEEDLNISSIGMDKYQEDISKFFSRIMLVERLRETRVFIGFTRVFPENGQNKEELISLLWHDSTQEHCVWLPAYEVFGEGIFFEFNESNIRKWQNSSVVDRIKSINKKYEDLQFVRRLNIRHITPRFVLIHTFAHLIMNRLIFECGYSTASLRERLYISDSVTAPMAGVLIYTAAGDSEGTMGGLVRMGKPGKLEPVLSRALSAASWCSADPVCMELAKMGGQGPDSCNLAACHCCALVPETACEEFNRFLDRGVIVGVPENKSLGYFI